MMLPYETVDNIFYKHGCLSQFTEINGSHKRKTRFRADRYAFDLNGQPHLHLGACLGPLDSIALDCYPILLAGDNIPEIKKGTYTGHLVTFSGKECYLGDKTVVTPYFPVSAFSVSEQQVIDYLRSAKDKLNAGDYSYSRGAWFCDVVIDRVYTHDGLVLATYSATNYDRKSDELFYLDEQGHLKGVFIRDLETLKDRMPVITPGSGHYQETQMPLF